ncbi:hypothetical protein QJ856_gp0033 [Tupanvirus deep ocean]|uniref:Uncharacterized protein n=2 Tax=Tupanvirus TaxID=2094720 RepID=A0AC62A6X8_9VIRU|nr:hypothetical protein QJ856_gp0033 [Tupanvirus deep ocean]QKU33450.1 hypothetical protein [Tupanvirus deep ocean]
MFDYIINKTKQNYIKLDEVTSFDDIMRAQNILYDRHVWEKEDRIIQTLRHGNFVPYDGYKDISYLLTSCDNKSKQENIVLVNETIDCNVNETKELNKQENKIITNETNDYIANKTKKCYVKLNGINSSDIIEETHKFLCDKGFWKDNDFVVHCKKPVGYEPPNCYIDISYLLKYISSNEKKY